ncbi:methyl-accepting chemotaxis protein [Roseicella aquatilis]|uniref:Methyl-accepting chemotaxis protein n=1 Tax=Roseicella aquatilis TaxID=2527868 RepID=A0A4R4DIS4_9PROT|nr:methyl-accepting chemotaxis protein [Roseicella aquatilis]TCZ60932.1 methyl-accepting chemotaxis protein [Roseicella aquatilis]
MRSIRTRLTVLATFLALLAAGLAADRAREAWDRAGQAARTAQAAAATDALLAAAAAWAVERGTGNGLLANPAAATPAQREALAAARRGGNEAFAAGLAAARALGDPGLAAAVLRAEAALRGAEALRTRLDAALATAGPAAPELRAGWFPGTSALIAATGEDLALAIEAALGATEPFVSRGLALQHGLWTAGEFAGRERGLVNGILAGGAAMTAAELRALGEARGRVLAAWPRVEALAGALGPEVGAAVAAARAAYLAGPFETLRQAVLRAGDPALPPPTDRRYPVEAAGWFREATGAMAPVLAAQRAAGAALQAQAREARQAQLVVAGLWLAALLAVVGIGVAAAFFAIRGVGRPLSGMAAAMARLAGGDLEVSVAGEARGDEVGALARALRVFRDGLRRARAMEAEAATEQAAKDRRQAAIDRITGEFGTAAATLTGALGAAAEGMRRSSDAMAEAVERTRQGATATATGAEATAQDLGAVAAATEELTASVGEIARQVAHAAAAARGAVERAEATDASVRGLSEAASQIGAVVRLISDIAGQTNLLALNATIEASRAGEAGKGFAVVASEVKQLAAQTAQATAEIGRQVAAIQGATREAVGAMHAMGEAIGSVDGIAAAIAAAVEEQGAATREISASVQSVARQNDGAVRAMREVTGAAEGADGAAQTVLGAAEEVTRISGTLRGAVDGFLDALRREAGAAAPAERVRAA